MFQRDGMKVDLTSFWFCVLEKFFQALFCAYRVEKSLHACACTEVCKTLRPPDMSIKAERSFAICEWRGEDCGSCFAASQSVSILYLLHLAFKEETNEKEDRKSAAELAMCLTMLPGQSVFAAETSTETETEAASESTGNHVEN